ncbi:MAG TPA: NADP-dependent oxidoreductase [Jatrophihabitantaceae bacterium]|nr:NADP-dependent oxidoreductase [Jatrophihabitantaceae bacterium]
MKAIRYNRFGAPDVLELLDVDIPEIADDQVLIRVAGTAHNSLDAKIRSGDLAGVIPVQLPHTPSLDVAGRIEAIGAAVTAWHEGDEVIGFLPIVEDGAAAGFVAAPADVLAAAPRGVALSDAAALPSSALTAWQALTEHGEIAGRRVLINGAGGGVGGYAVQLAAALGAHVTAVAGPRSHEAVRRFGADDVVDYTSTDVTGLDPRSFALVVNLVTVPGPTSPRLTELVADRGAVVTTTFPVPGDPSRDVDSVALFVRSDATQLAELAARVEQHALDLNITGRYPLAELSRVHALDAAGALHGRTVVVPDSE